MPRPHRLDPFVPAGLTHTDTLPDDPCDTLIGPIETFDPQTEALIESFARLYAD